MTPSLLELLGAARKEEPSLSPGPAAASGTSATGTPTYLQDFPESWNARSENEESQSESPNGENELAESLIDLMASSISEAEPSNSLSATEKESTSPEEELDSLEKEGPHLIEKSSDYIVISPSSDPMEKETSKSDEKSLISDSEKLKASDSSENVEFSKSKAKKTVTMSDEDSAFSENPSLTKIAMLRPCPSVGTNLEFLNSIDNSTNGFAMMEEAWERLKKSYVYFKGQPVGTLAAMDPSAEDLNYNQVLNNVLFLDFLDNLKHYLGFTLHVSNAVVPSVSWW